jgi:hypothetical protein
VNGTQRGPVTIGLSQAQVNRLVGDLQRNRGPIPTPPHVAALRSVVANQASGAEPFDGGRLSKSLLWGLFVLSCLPADGSHARVKEVAEWSGLSPSSARRYLKTLVVAGVVERDPASRRYKLVETR